MASTLAQVKVKSATKKLTRLELVRLELLDWYEEQITRKNTEIVGIPWRDYPVCSSSILIGELFLDRFGLEPARKHYYRFVDSFPNWEVIARSTIQQLQARLPRTNIWRRRAFTLHYLARWRSADDAEVPTLSELAQLPGISPTSATLVRSIVFGIPDPQTGAELKRFFARLRGGELADFATTAKSAQLQKDAAEFSMHPDHIRLNWATKQFVRDVCQRDNPRCLSCPLQSMCAAKALYQSR